MSKTLKWILGVVALLVVVALVFGAVWLVQHRTQVMTYRPNAQQPNNSAPQGTPNAPNGQYPQQNGPRGYDDGRRGPMMNGWGGRGPMEGWGDRGPMMGRHQFSPFGMGFFFLGGIFRLLIPLVVLALVAILFYQLGKRAAPSSAAWPEPKTSAPAKRSTKSG
jgi:hypothetical protein